MSIGTLATPGTASATEFTIWKGTQIISDFRFIKQGVTTKSADKPLELTRIELLGKIAPGWKLIEPLPVFVHINEDGQYLLTDEIFSIYGEGSNIGQAQQDLVASLIEYYELISAYEDEPSQQLLRMLRKYIRPHLAAHP